MQKINITKSELALLVQHHQVEATRHYKAGHYIKAAEHRKRIDELTGTSAVNKQSEEGVIWKSQPWGQRNSSKL